MHAYGIEEGQGPAVHPWRDCVCGAGFVSSSEAAVREAVADLAAPMVESWVQRRDAAQVCSYVSLSLGCCCY